MSPKAISPPKKRCTEAQQALALANLGLAYQQANAAWQRGGAIRRAGSFDDALQVTLHALAVASRSWQPERGCRFSTHATMVIRQRLKKAVLEGGIIRIPWYAFQRKKLAQPGWKGMVDRACKIAQWPQAPTERGQLEDLELPAPEAEPRLEVDERTALHEALGHLDPRWREVIHRRFGLDGDPPETLEAIGRRLGICKEAVRQIEVKALALLKRLLIPRLAA